MVEPPSSASYEVPLITAEQAQPKLRVTLVLVMGAGADPEGDKLIAEGA